MKLCFEEIKNITLGAADLRETERGIAFFRCTKEQSDIYKECGRLDIYEKTFHTAGVKLAFKTNSKKLFIAFDTPEMGEGTFFVEVLKNGEIIGELGVHKNHDNETSLNLDGKEFLLGDDEKEIEILLPYIIRTTLREIELDDGASLSPKKLPKTILTIGDSITHGSVATRPSRRYAAKLARALDADEHCLAVGSDFFREELGKRKSPVEPDYVIVAYGTNDWGWIGREDFIRECNGFFNSITKTYPTSKIFAVTPIWCKAYDTDEEHQIGKFPEFIELLKGIISKYPPVEIIDGTDLVPHDPKYFDGMCIHPTDEGFCFHAENLTKAIKEKL